MMHNGNGCKMNTATDDPCSLMSARETVKVCIWLCRFAGVIGEDTLNVVWYLGSRRVHPGGRKTDFPFCARWVHFCRSRVLMGGAPFSLNNSLVFVGPRSTLWQMSTVSSLGCPICNLSGPTSVGGLLLCRRRICGVGVGHKTIQALRSVSSTSIAQD